MSSPGPQQPLPSLCDRVRSSCLAWTLNSSEVTINKDAIPRIASEIIQNSSPLWDGEGWHYEPPKRWPRRIRDERIALYILALDAINFCFWPDGNYEYEDLAVALSSIASQDHESPSHALVDSTGLETYALSAERLGTITTLEMTALFLKNHPKVPSDIDKRRALWNEIGSVLVEKFEGSALNLISQAASSAPVLVKILVDHFPGFHDYLQSRGKEVWFLKRAQICVGDWNASLHLRLHDMDKLTTFADYRVPQLLREYEVIVYCDHISSKVDSQCELEAGGVEEASIRAATVTAVELIVQEILNRGSSDVSRCWTAVEVDWLLWQLGEKRRKGMRPHHRVRTTFY